MARYCGMSAAACRPSAFRAPPSASRAAAAACSSVSRPPSIATWQIITSTLIKWVIDPSYASKRLHAVLSNRHTTVSLAATGA
eukprot:5337039-Pyramimonas_sp.AAC.2